MNAIMLATFVVIFNLISPNVFVRWSEGSVPEILGCSGPGCVSTFRRSPQGDDDLRGMLYVPSSSATTGSMSMPSALTVIWYRSFTLTVRQVSIGMTAEPSDDIPKMVASEK